MEGVTHRKLQVNGINIHIAEQGSGPLVLLLHGFPSLWYSWRHQIPFLAKAGYHAVAMDFRGFGQSDVPTGVDQYTQLHHAGDVIGVLDAIGEKQAFIVGHDAGSTITSVVALLRADRVRGFVNLGVPFFPRGGQVDPITGLRFGLGENIYMVKWQTSDGGEAEADFAKHGTKVALAKILCCRDPQVWVAKDGKTILDGLQTPDHLPAWLTEDDLKYYVESFDKTGMTGAFNFYRTMRSSWELLAPWTNQGSAVPCLYMAGELDMTLSMLPSGFVTSDAYKSIVPNLRQAIILPKVAHFLAEEAPEQVNKHLLEFLQQT